MKKEKLGKKFRGLMVKELEGKFKTIPNLFVTNFGNMRVNDFQIIRNKLKKISVDYIVVKNTFCRLALRESRFEKLIKFVKGSCAIVYGMGDPVMITKTLVGFSNDYSGFNILVANIEGETVCQNEIEQIAKLPSQEILLAKLVFVLNYPISGFVSLTSRLITNFVSVIRHICDSYENRDSYTKGG